jgi:hypothetical protein
MEAKMKTIFFLLAIIACAAANEGCQVVPFKDFDVGSTAWDANALALNPKWGKQIEAGQLPDPAKSCPVNSDHASDWTSSPQYPECTAVPVYYNSGTWCGPHVNFMPVSYEGIVTWESHSNSIYDDDDYSLNVTRSDDALYTSNRNEIHIEFNSEETVDNWDNTHTWWDNFHHNGVDHDDATASGMINGDSVIVIGLLGLDLGHSPTFTELHPVYAMFVHLRSDDLTQSTWAFFVRNWGDEGFCASGQENLYMANQIIKVKIPNAASFTAANTWEGAQNQNNLDPMGWSVGPSGDGMLLTFKLLPPDAQSWFVGDLTFTTRVRVHPSAVAATGHTAIQEKELNQKELAARVSRLPESAQKELLGQIYNLAPKAKPVQVKPTILSTAANTGESFSQQPVIIKGSDLVRHQDDPKLAQFLEKKKKLVEQFLKERGIQ